MQKIAERQYLLETGETATVSVKASGTAHVVAYDLGNKSGQLGEGQSLDVSKPTNGFRSLTLLFTFSGSSDGQYVVTISGSNSGSDTDTIDQGSFGIPATSAEYIFQ